MSARNVVTTYFRGVWFGMAMFGAMHLADLLWRAAQ